MPTRIVSARGAVPAGYAIRPADPATVADLVGIEVAAAARFPEEDLPAERRGESFDVEELEAAAREDRLWTAVENSTGRPVGFALADVVDDSAYLEELDVLPEHGRRGLGAALVRTVIDWARARGLPAVTLTTFRHLPWNAPFYRRLGFEECPEAALGPELATLLRDEAAHGLDPARRVAMRLDLGLDPTGQPGRS